MEADRKIPAVKLFVSQLNRARQQSEAVGATGGVDDGTHLVSLSLFGVEFTRVWVQVCNSLYVSTAALHVGALPPSRAVVKA